MVDVGRELVPAVFCRPMVSEICETYGEILLHTLPVSPGMQSVLFGA